MPPRLRNSVVLATLILVACFLWMRSASQHYGRPKIVLEGNLGHGNGNFGKDVSIPKFMDNSRPDSAIAEDVAEAETPSTSSGAEHDAPSYNADLHLKVSASSSESSSMSEEIPVKAKASNPADIVQSNAEEEQAAIEPQSEAQPEPEPEPEPEKQETILQKQFEMEYEENGKNESVGAIYGNTLDNLLDPKPREGAATSNLTATNVKLNYTNKRPYNYNPYPEYNTLEWKAANKGVYVPCDGPHGPLDDVMVFSGYSKAFEGEPAMGTYDGLNIDSQLCFERETRLATYGLQGNLSDSENNPISPAKELTDWDNIKWGELQEKCVAKNLGRFPKVQKGWARFGNLDFRNRKERLHAPKVKPRTAVLIRLWSGKPYSENDKQNIRSLVTELALRSGGEYQVYLLVHIKDNTLPIWTNAAAYEEAVHNNVPKEFWDMTVLWTESQIKERYPKTPEETQVVHRAQYFPLQVFSEKHPEFEYFWNWEADDRYTGHHYDFFEKLAEFSKAQPRKGLWERNERYYIPTFHGRYTTEFRDKVQLTSGSDTIWGPVPVTSVKPTGPKPPVLDPKDDNYEWGVDEEADYISLAPMFNPKGTNWIISPEVWGFAGPNDTPKRTAIGTPARCSQKLLNAMHLENLKGNHIASEMTGPSISLLHGLKAVYAPIPSFFDRPWDGESLERYFNPGPKGESGSVISSPFTWGYETRYKGSTWYYRATPPQRLFNHWMGWEDTNIGGPEWEKTHGRPCLPPLLLHPIKTTVETSPGHSSESVTWS